MLSIRIIITSEYKVVDVIEYDAEFPFFIFVEDGTANMESSEAKLSHQGDDFLLVVMRRTLKAVDCLEDFVVVWVAEYASQGNVLICLVCSQECALFVEMPVVEVKSRDDMEKDEEFFAGWGR